MADPEAAVKSRCDHRQLAPLMFAFIAAGGVLSLTMQHQPVSQSLHFWTGAIALTVLSSNALIAVSGVGQNKAAFQTVHAYLGSTALYLMLLHALLGLKWGLAI